MACRRRVDRWWTSCLRNIYLHGLDGYIFLYRLWSSAATPGFACSRSPFLLSCYLFLFLYMLVILSSSVCIYDLLQIIWASFVDWPALHCLSAWLCAHAFVIQGGKFVDLDHFCCAAGGKSSCRTKRRRTDRFYR